MHRITTTAEQITIAGLDGYEQKVVNNTLVLTKKARWLTRDELFALDLRYSKPATVVVNGRPLNSTSYTQILNEVINDVSINEFLEYTSMNTVPGVCTLKGFKYNEDLKKSIQGANAHKTLREIVQHAQTLELHITLNSGIVCQFKK
jgi:hypothetical protein